MPNHDDANDYASLPALRVMREPRRVMREPRGHPGCRYYGNSNLILLRTGKLVSTGGNECALIHTSLAPCQMEMAKMNPDEAFCPHAIAELGSRPLRKS
jgi:hypothetical protein